MGVQGQVVCSSLTVGCYFTLIFDFGMVQKIFTNRILIDLVVGIFRSSIAGYFIFICWPKTGTGWGQGTPEGAVFAASVALWYPLFAIFYFHNFDRNTSQNPAPAAIAAVVSGLIGIPALIGPFIIAADDKLEFKQLESDLVFIVGIVLNVICWLSYKSRVRAYGN